jgi:pimeloyl-ACP methyl ester carboxylesterase
MATFVLVHGAWAGAHTWRFVRPLLWQAGHQVFTPSLTGIGERAHLTGPHVDLSVHVDDVVNCVLYEDLDDLVLTGFSYGGMVVTGAVAHIAARIRELVYLDAFVPADGHSALELLGLAEPGSPPAVRQLGENWQLAPVDRTYDDPAVAAFAEPRRVAQPIRTVRDRVTLPQPLEGYAFGRTYVKCLGDPRGEGRDAFYEAADRYRDNPAWRYREHPSNHMLPLNDPAWVADALLALI